MKTKILKKYVNPVMTTLVALIMFSAGQTAAHAQNYMTQMHQPARNTVYESKLRHQVAFLSDTICGGRATGTRGNVEAACWLQREFSKIGLLKFGDSYAKRIYAGQGKIGRNIMGMLPGSNHFPKKQYVIVGAHFDHLGELDGRLYPGADANASGTVALVNLAKMLSTTRMIGKSHDSNVIFVAFDGREHDLAGSRALWRMIENGELLDPQTGNPITRKQIALMVNIDQIGSTMSPLKSGREDYIIMLGTESLKPIKRDLLNACNRMFAIDMDIDLTYYGSENFTKVFYRLSDQRVFVENGIPAVLFTSGITMNTNKTRDNAESINLEILRKRIYLIYHWLDKML